MARARNERRTTYIRKIGDGAFEYGWSFPGRNFRKQNIYEPAGVTTTVAGAEALRLCLEAEAFEADTAA